MNEPITSPSLPEPTGECVALVPEVDKESVRAYLSDYECLMEGVSFFIQLEQKILDKKDISPIREHYDAHPEDKLCEIARPKGGGGLPGNLYQ